MTIKTISKTSVFPASVQVISKKLQRLRTLQHIAAPYAAFEPLDGSEDILWQSGQSFEFRFRLFGFIPFGIHRICVVDFDESAIYTRESNTHVPVWNHRITLEPLGNNCTRYTDEVEIGAGWKTPFVCLWARMFYAHRQKRWIKLLRDEQ